MYKNRIDAALSLSSLLDEHINSDTLILGLARGGIPLAYTVAKVYGLDWDIMNVRKIGSLYNPEFSLGSITHDGKIHLSPEVHMYIPKWSLPDIIHKEATELHRRNQLYRRGKPPLELVVKNRNVILIDDGIATGSTVMSSVDVLKKMGARRIIVAAPVGSKDAVDELRQHADEVVVPLTPQNFGAVGSFYADFPQVSDEEVLSYVTS